MAPMKLRQCPSARSPALRQAALSSLVATPPVTGANLSSFASTSTVCPSASWPPPSQCRSLPCGYTSTPRRPPPRAILPCAPISTTHSQPHNSFYDCIPSARTRHPDPSCQRGPPVRVVRASPYPVRASALLSRTFLRMFPGRSQPLPPLLGISTSMTTRFHH
jgi:hypothetical protein